MTTITVKNTEYTVIAKIAINENLYPNRAKFVSGTAYLRRSNGETVYSLPINLGGVIRTDLSPLNCGKMTDAEVNALP